MIEWCDQNLIYERTPCDWRKSDNLLGSTTRLSCWRRLRKTLFCCSSAWACSCSWVFCRRPSSSRPVVSRKRRYARSNAWPIVNVISSALIQFNSITPKTFRFLLKTYEFVANEDVTGVLLRIDFFGDETEKLLFGLVVGAVRNAMQRVLMKNPLQNQLLFATKKNI